MPHAMGVSPSSCILCVTRCLISLSCHLLQTDTGRLVKLPLSVISTLTQISRTTRKLRHLRGHEPSVAEVGASYSDDL